jgi:hypothetical protein
MIPAGHEDQNAAMASVKFTPNFSKNWGRKSDNLKVFTGKGK